MRKPHQDQVYVVSLVGDSINRLINQNEYEMPVGRRFPKIPPEYMGFRFKGKLQFVGHVDIIGYREEGRLLYQVLYLGPNLLKNRTIKSGKIKNTRAYLDFDILFSSNSVKEAFDKQKGRETI